MGLKPDKETTTQSTSGTQTVTASPQQQELDKLNLQQRRQTIGPQTEAQVEALQRVTDLFRGEGLPGFLSPLTEGLSEDVIGDISRKAVGDIQPGFQSSGILDSGVAAAVSGQVAGDVRRSAAEFNIGNLQNLLNLALSGQAQVQQPIVAGAGQLGQSLAGLRSITTTGRGSSTQAGMNPFMKSFQTSMGQAPATFLKQGGEAFWR